MSETIYQYTPGEMDWLLLNWMQRMHHDGDLEHTLSKAVQTPLAFLSFMAARRLFFRLSELNNIIYAAWFEPCMGSAFMSFYVSPEVRDVHTEKVYWLFDMLNLAFSSGVPTICGFIKERETQAVTEKFIKTHLRLGYQYSGMVPHLFDGHDCHAVSYTVESWEALKDGRWRKKWGAARGIGTTDITSGARNGVVAARE